MTKCESCDWLRELTALQDRLLVAYRLGRHPGGKVLDRLAFVRDELKALEERQRTASERAAAEQAAEEERAAAGHQRFVDVGGGWGWPLGSKSAHWFPLSGDGGAHGSMSACRSWGFYYGEQEPELPDGTARCKRCETFRAKQAASKAST